MRTLFIFLLFTLTSNSLPVAHDFHLSVCEINYNSTTKALEISYKVFIDDLELALKENGAKKMHLGTEKESEEADYEIYEYLKQNFSLSSTEVYSYNYIGKEMSPEEDAFWCYLEIENIEPPVSLEIKNEVLLSTFDDQKNIVQIKMPNDKQGYLIFDNKTKVDKVDF